MKWWWVVLLAWLAFVGGVLAHKGSGHIGGKTNK